ncbi:MAG TPA: hypothetical protein V6C65_35605 [Allocoleopsis sp.]
MSDILFLPGDPGFQETLENPDLFNWVHFANQKGQATFVVRAETGLLDCVNDEELEEYLNGGEYDLRLTCSDEDEFDC